MIVVLAFGLATGVLDESHITVTLLETADLVGFSQGHNSELENVYCRPEILLFHKTNLVPRSISF